MKRNLKPEIEFIRFCVEDIITTSGKTSGSEVIQTERLNAAPPRPNTNPYEQ